MATEEQKGAQTFPFVAHFHSISKALRSGQREGNCVIGCRRNQELALDEG